MSLAAALAAAPAAAKGPGSLISPAGIAPAGSPYRYVTVSPGFPDKLTVVARIDRRGGKIRRWWYLRGGWYVPAVAYDGTAGGLSADGSTLLLTRQATMPSAGPPKTTLAIMETDRPTRTAFGESHDPFVDFARLKGEWGLVSLSPDGATAFVSHHPVRFRGHDSDGVPIAPRGTDVLVVRALDTDSGRLLPGPVLDRDGDRDRLDGIPYAQVAGPGGRWTYTLYSGDRRKPFVYALDTERGRGTRIDLPLQGIRDPYSLNLRLGHLGQNLRVSRRWRVDGRIVERTLVEIDTATFAARRPRPQAVASAADSIVPRALGLALGAFVSRVGED
ncbi:MAG: hypothetical protein JJE35_10480 [Thermoleophilia bacterium]|nr:hypothetical protein [Thermoleophilia bacterium]